MSGFSVNGAAPWIVTVVVVPSVAVIARAIRSVYQTHTARIAQLEAREAVAHETQLSTLEKHHSAQIEALRQVHDSQSADHRANLAAQIAGYQLAINREGEVRLAMASLQTLPTVIADGIEAMEQAAVGEREHTTVLVRQALHDECERISTLLRDCTDRIIAAVHQSADRPSQAPSKPKGPRP
jgi:hypothetical protein